MGGRNRALGVQSWRNCVEQKTVGRGRQEIRMTEKEGQQRTNNAPSISKLHGIKKEVRESENSAGNANHDHVHSPNQTASRRRWSGSNGRCRCRRRRMMVFVGV